MTATQVGVENAACLLFLMVNLSAKLLRETRENCLGINDLKSQYRGVKYALETIKLIEPKAEIILIEEVKKWTQNAKQNLAKLLFTCLSLRKLFKFD